MASYCGYCELLRCGSSVSSQETLMTLISNILCEWAEGGNGDSLTLCDDNGPFVRTFIYDASGQFVEFIDTTLDGSPYVAVGNVTTCAGEAPFPEVSYFNTEATDDPVISRLILEEGQNAVRVWIGETPRNESDFFLYIARNAVVLKVLVTRWSSPVILVPSGAGTALAFGTSDGREIGVTPLTLTSSFPVSSGVSGTANADLATVPIWAPSAPHVVLPSNNSAIEIQGAGWGVVFVSEFDGASWTPPRSVIVNGTYPIKELCTYKQIALATYNGSTVSVSAPSGSTIGGTSVAATFGIVPTGTTHNVTANSGADLVAKMAIAVSGDRILLPAGTYTLPAVVNAATFAANVLAGNIGGEGIVIQGATGNRADVTIIPHSTANSTIFFMAGATDPFLWRDLTLNYTGTSSSYYVNGGVHRLENVRIFGPQSVDTNGSLVTVQPASTAIIDFQAFNCLFEDSIGDLYSGSVQAVGTFQGASICKLMSVTGRRAGNSDDTRQCFTTHSGFPNEMYSIDGSDARLNVIANDSNVGSISYVFFSRFSPGTRRVGIVNHYSYFNYQIATAANDAWNPQSGGWSIGNRIDKTGQIFSGSIFNNSLVPKVVANNLSLNDGRAIFVRAGGMTVNFNMIRQAGEGIRKDNFTGPSTAIDSHSNNTFLNCAVGWGSTINNFITGFISNAFKTSGTSISVNASADAAMLKGSSTIDPTISASYTAGVGDITGVDAAIDANFFPTLGGNCDDNGLGSSFDYVGGYDFEQFPVIYKETITSRGARTRPRVDLTNDIYPHRIV